MKYRVLTDENPDELAKEVEKQVGLGWEPQGGVTLALSIQHYTAPNGLPLIETQKLYAQALVMAEKE